MATVGALPAASTAGLQRLREQTLLGLSREAPKTVSEAGRLSVKEEHLNPRRWLLQFQQSVIKTIYTPRTKKKSCIIVVSISI